MRIRLFALGHGWNLRQSLGSERQGSTYGSWQGSGPRLAGRPAVQEFVGIGGERSWDPSFLPQASWKPAALGAGRARVGLSRELAETRREGPAGSEAVPRGPAPRHGQMARHSLNEGTWMARRNSMRWAWILSIVLTPLVFTPGTIIGRCTQAGPFAGTHQRPSVITGRIPLSNTMTWHAYSIARSTRT